MTERAWAFRVVGELVERGTDETGARYLEALERRARPETVRQAARTLQRVRAALELGDLSELTQADVDRWQASRLAAGASHRTVNLEVGTVAAALTAAVRRGELASSPLEGWERLAVKPRDRRRMARALTDLEASTLLRAARELDAASRHPWPRSATLEALLATGARWNEMRQATWGDVLEERAALLLRPETTKSGRARLVPLALETLEQLRELRQLAGRLLGRQPGAGDVIWRSAEGAPWPRGTGNFHRYLREATRRAGLARCDSAGRVLHVHALRHTAATRWANARMPLLELSRVLGHSDPKLTAQVYVAAQLDAGRSTISSLPSLHDSGRLPLSGPHS